jgi:hypothetical protein
LKKPMKPRHAAALALVGWSLVVLPPLSHNPFQYQVLGTLDSEAYCKIRLDDMKQLAEMDFRRRYHLDPNLINFYSAMKPAKHADELGDIVAMMNVVITGRCIASADPRLKGK